MIAYFFDAPPVVTVAWSVSYPAGTGTGVPVVTNSVQSYGTDVIWIPAADPKPTDLGPNPYQRRRALSLRRIRERVRAARQNPVRVVVSARQGEAFARRTCSVASRWMVLQ